MKLKHPDGDLTVETDSPEPYLSQGWAEAQPKAPEKPADEKVK